MAFNLTRAAGTLASAWHAKAAFLSSSSCIDEVGALRSRGVVLSPTLDRYYDPLRLPLGRPPLPDSRL